MCWPARTGGSGHACASCDVDMQKETTRLAHGLRNTGFVGSSCGSASSGSAGRQLQAAAGKQRQRVRQQQLRLPGGRSRRCQVSTGACMDVSPVPTVSPSKSNCRRQARQAGSNLQVSTPPMQLGFAAKIAPAPHTRSTAPSAIARRSCSTALMQPPHLEEAPGEARHGYSQQCVAFRQCLQSAIKDNSDRG